MRRKACGWGSASEEASPGPRRTRTASDSDSREARLRMVSPESPKGRAAKPIADSEAKARSRPRGISERLSFLRRLSYRIWKEAACPTIPYAIRVYLLNWKSLLMRSTMSPLCLINHKVPCSVFDRPDCLSLNNAQLNSLGNLLKPLNYLSREHLQHRQLRHQIRPR